MDLEGAEGGETNKEDEDEDERKTSVSGEGGKVIESQIWAVAKWVSWGWGGEGICFHSVNQPALEPRSSQVLSGGLRLGKSTSPRHETPVPSMATLHTAHTGTFFRKTFSRKLCGSAFRGWGWGDRQTGV